MRFLARAYRFDDYRLAVYVPKNTIEFYLHDCDLKIFIRASAHDDNYQMRTNQNDEWTNVNGYLGYYGSRNTLRLVFAVDKIQSKNLVGKIIEFNIEFITDDD